MNRVAIAFLTCDRVELTKRSIEPLLQPNKFDLHWVDGSKTGEGIDLPREYSQHKFSTHYGVVGGSGVAIVYALTTLLKKGLGEGTAYDYIGLVENDVLLDPDFFEPMMALFEQGRAEGMEVGAVSARAYEDRILIQRDGYGVMHNLGAGMIVFSRNAAKLVLQHYRTVWTTENRLLFAQLSGIDIGKYWAFRGNENFLVADWNFDRVLASYGYASLALTPNKATMLDQDIAPLGLKYADGNFALARNPEAFNIYRRNLKRVQIGEWQPGVHEPFFRDDQGQMIFAHQIPQIGGVYSGNWRIRDFLPFGPFVWKAGAAVQDEACSTQMPGEYPTLTVPISGPCSLMISGGERGGVMRIEDEQSGFVAEPALPAESVNGQLMQISVPSGAGYREIKLTALGRGLCFFGVKTRDPQPVLPHVRFDFDTLPPP